MWNIDTFVNPLSKINRNDEGHAGMVPFNLSEEDLKSYKTVKERFDTTSIAQCTD